MSISAAQLLNLGFLVPEKSTTWEGVTVEFCDLYR
jgi:hypothetical protein